MTSVQYLFWRAITAADFFSIERARKFAPAGGGGQSYISISFRGLTHQELGDFLGVTPASDIRDVRPEVRLPAVAAAQDMAISAPLIFSARYRPPQRDDRYRIARQNRQYQQRHPAWTAQFGFPQAPHNVSTSHDTRMPDLTYLKVFIAKLADGQYAAGYYNTDVAPAQLASVPGLGILFRRYDEGQSAGIVDLRRSGILLAHLAGDENPDRRLAEEAPEVLETIDNTKVAAGKRPSGQGIRARAPERQALERRAIEVAAAQLKAQGWRVEDVGGYRPYDLHCSRRTEELLVEVKGTTGGGSSVLLTPGEVAHARDNANLSLMVVFGIQLDSGEEGAVVATGGTLKTLTPWAIDADGVLKPTGYEYRLD